jgi:hypothetical protein
VSVGANWSSEFFNHLRGAVIRNINSEPLSRMDTSGRLVGNSEVESSFNYDNSQLTSCSSLDRNTPQYEEMAPTAPYGVL